MLEIRYDDRKLKDLQRTLAGIPNAMPRVMSRGLNRTATEARTQLSRFLSGKVGLRVKDVRSRLGLQRATHNNWRSAVRFLAATMPIIRFPTEQTSTGVTYKLRRGKSATILHAFIARMPAGHKGVFLRARYAKGRYVSMQGKKKEAIYEQKIVLSEIFTGSESELDRIYRDSHERLAKNIHDQVQLILRRRTG